MRISAAIALVATVATGFMVSVRAEANAEATVELNEKNFEDHIANRDLVMINFYTSWCGHCQTLEPEFEKAAKEVEGENIILAKINCEDHEEFCKEQAVQAYPTLKIYKKGTVTNYVGTRKADDLVRYIRRHVGDAVKEVKSEDLAKFSESDRVVIVAVLPQGPERKALAATFEKVAEYYRNDFVFGAVESSPDVKDVGVVLYKKFDEGKNVYQGPFNDNTLITFIRENFTPIIDEIGPQNYKHYLEGRTPLSYFFFDSADDQKTYGPDLEALAKELKGQMNFVYVDSSKFGAHAENVGLQKKWPAFAIQDPATAAKFPLDQNEPLTMERIKAHVESVLNGALIAKLKSETVPESQDGPVTIVVAHNYKDIVEDMSKDVLIEYHAPWCSFCKKLAPILDEVGELYKGSNVVIAKMDATLNDLPPSVPFELEGYPTIKFRKAGTKEYIDYQGDRSKAGFIKFIQANAVNKVDIDYTLTMKSEAVPETQEGPVMVVVAKTYAQIVEDMSKDVLIEYYAPWCGHCKKLAPILDEVGELYKGSNVVIAKFDEEANDLPSSVPFKVEGYPTIKFRKAGTKEYIDYQGDRSKAAFIKFIQANAVNKVDIDYTLTMKSEAVPETQEGPVMVVVAKTYEQIVEDMSKDVLIEYYAPWCGHCKKLAPILDEVGELYKGSNVVIAKFDEEANDLPSSVPFEIEGYPTIKFRKAGTKEYIDYKGDRSKDGFIKFIQANAVNKVEIDYTLTLKSEAVPETQEGPVMVVVANTYEQIVEDMSKDVLIEYYAPWCGHCKKLAPILDEVGELYKGSNVVIAKFDEDANDLPSSVPFKVEGYPTIKFRKAGTKEYIDYKGDRSKDGFIKFIQANAVNKVDIDYTLTMKSEAVPETQEGPVTVVVAKTYEQIVEDMSKDVLIEYYAPWCGHCKKLAPILDEVGELYKGSNVVIAKFDEEANDLPSSVPFKVEGYPTIKFRKAGTKEYIDYKGDRSKDGFIKFIQANAVNKVDIDYTITMKSEAVPETQEGPVTVVVAKTYEQIVEDMSKDVLIEYYAPWCGHCKKLAPILDEVGELYKGSNVVIAKFDEEANDLPSSVPFKVEGYPTIKFRKAGTKEYIDYKGDRSKDGFIKFIQANAVNKVKIDYTITTKSEAAPETQEGSVTVVVAKTYTQIVEDMSKNVLIEYYAPWCGHCKKLAPILDELGELYKGSDVVIAKIDAEANDLPSSLPFKVEGYPTIKFRKAGSSEYMNYEGKRTKEAFVEFLSKNAASNFKPNMTADKDGEDAAHDEL